VNLFQQAQSGLQRGPQLIGDGGVIFRYSKQGGSSPARLRGQHGSVSLLVPAILPAAPMRGNSPLVPGTGYAENV
jgi:hypothetical protein